MWRRTSGCGSWMGAFTLLLTAILPISCTGQGESDSESLLDDKTTQVAKYSYTPLPQAEIERRKARIRTHFSDKLQMLEAIATTQTDSGQIIDWVLRPENLEAPPPFAPGSHQETASVPEGEEIPKTEVQLQPWTRGPEGTVPVVRFNVENYLKHVRDLPEHPEQVVSAPPSPSPLSTGYYYAYLKQTLFTFYGTHGYINMWDTAGPVENEASVAQAAVTGGNPLQAIEAGKTENNLLNGDYAPHFFVYYRTAGSAQGDWVGGYNQLVAGWGQYSRTIAPGMLITTLSQQGGAQYSLPLHIEIYNGNWWVGFADEWVGYFPRCINFDPSPSCETDGRLFSDSGIRDHASTIQWYGEVYDKSAPSPTTTDMGSGEFADAWFGYAAYFRNMEALYAGGWAYFTSAYSIPGTTDSACYSLVGPYFSDVDVWRNYFFYGGPGADSAGCL